MKKRDSISGKLIRIFVLTPLILFVMYRMYVIAPQFFPYLGGVFLLGFLIFVASKLFHRFTASKCAVCGGPLSNMGVKKVFAASMNQEDGKTFAPLGKKIYRCVDCEEEYHELVYYPIGVPATSYKEMHEYNMKNPFLKLRMKTELPNVDLKKKPYKTITKQEYIDIKRKLVKEVTTHNARNGYTRNAIKIDVEN